MTLNLNYAKISRKTELGPNPSDNTDAMEYAQKGI